jgi:K+-sensing histidine kinase KdpD
VLAHTPDGTRFQVQVEVDHDTVVFSVEDAGAGFSDGSVVDRGASSRDSTGLGLDIVRRTVEGAGGKLAIGESRTHEGAGIVIRLPLVSDL